MSDRLPVVSGAELIRALTKKRGYYIRSQEGSHVHLRHPEYPPLTIPNHREIARGTLRAILRQAGISPDEFRTLVR
jgi:predicted RNA binding protein YcfA (HicA-like mRNA interferase family)